MFSLGCVAYNLYNTSINKTVLVSSNSIYSYRSAVERIFPLDMQKIPTTLQGPLQRILAIPPEQRFDSIGFLNSEYFGEVAFRALRYLRDLLEKDPTQKIQFLKGLPQALPRFPYRVLLQSVLPPLIVELKNPMLIPYALSNVLWIAEKIEKPDFTKRILIIKR
jgi:hypothetical protein